LRRRRRDSENFFGFVFFIDCAAMFGARRWNMGSVSADYICC